MDLIQSVVIILASYLINRIIIDSKTHLFYIDYLLRKHHFNFSTLISFILFLSYGMSLFFPNTVVVLSLLPIVNYLSKNVKEDNIEHLNLLMLALIYGANIGGMGSLVGSPLNFVFIGLIEANQIAGKEYVSFFTWLIVGIPGSFVFLLISKYILGSAKKLSKDRIEIQFDLSGITPKKAKKYLLFFAFATSILIFLSAIKFLFDFNSPSGRNLLDLFFITFLLVVIFLAFLHPRKKRDFETLVFNLNLLIATIFTFPLIIYNQFIKENNKSGKFTNSIERTDNFIANIYDSLIFQRVDSNFIDFRKKNPYSFVSLNKILFDLPYSGFLFVIVISVVFIVSITWGDNPATKVIDGTLIQWLGNNLKGIIPINVGFIYLLFILIFLTIFLTEIMNNTTIVLIFSTILLSIPNIPEWKLFISLLAVTIAAGSAFMTPIATTANMLVYASSEHRSLKMMLKKGFWLNLFGSIFLTAFFWLLSFFFRN